MENNNEPFIDEESLKNRVAASNYITTITARTEALNIVVSIMNGILGAIKAEKGNDFIPESIIGAIQTVVNNETEKTNAVFTELQKLTGVELPENSTKEAAQEETTQEN